MSFQDDVAPFYYGQDRIKVALADADQVLRAATPIVVAIDYSAALPRGVRLPLELSVIGPDGRLVSHTIARRFAPRSLVFTPRQGGTHLVRVAETYHDQLWGALELAIIGESLAAAGI
jgi:hypothetical protein